MLTLPLFTSLKSDQSNLKKNSTNRLSSEAMSNAILSSIPGYFIILIFDDANIFLKLLFCRFVVIVLLNYVVFVFVIVELRQLIVVVIVGRGKLIVVVI